MGAQTIKVPKQPVSHITSNRSTCITFSFRDLLITQSAFATNYCVPPRLSLNLYILLCIKVGTNLYVLLCIKAGTRTVRTPWVLNCSGDRSVPCVIRHAIRSPDYLWVHDSSSMFYMMIVYCCVCVTVVETDDVSCCVSDGDCCCVVVL